MWPFSTKAKTPARGNAASATDRLPNFVADIAPTIVPVWLANKAKYNAWKIDRAVRDGMVATTWVYVCVTRLMDAVACVPWKAKRLTSPGVYEQRDDDPLGALIARPNAFFSWGQLAKIWTAHMNLGGNAVFKMVMVNGQCAEIWPLFPDCVLIWPDTQEYIQKYQYNLNGVLTDMPTDEIIHDMFPNPADTFWGLGPLQAAAKIVDTDAEAVDFNKIALQNFGVPDAIVSFKHPLNQVQFDDARAAIKKSFQGQENAHMPVIMGNDAVWQQITQTMKELDFIASRRMTAVEICGAFKVPPPVAGLYESAALKVETARMIFWLDTVIPFLEGMKSVLNRSLAPKFGPDAYLDYDVSGVEALAAVFSAKVDTGFKLWSMGVPFNTVNHQLGLGFDEIEGGDIGWLSSTLTPAEANAGPTPSVAGGKPDEQPAAPPKGGGG
jgi:HK97 family phage portal protein